MEQTSNKQTKKKQKNTNYIRICLEWCDWFKLYSSLKYRKYNKVFFLKFLQSLSLKLEDELRKNQLSGLSHREPESESARRNAEKRLFGSVGTSANQDRLQSERIRQEMARYASMRDPSLR